VINWVIRVNRPSANRESSEDSDNLQEMVSVLTAFSCEKKKLFVKIDTIPHTYEPPHRCKAENHFAHFLCFLRKALYPLFHVISKLHVIHKFVLKAEKFTGTSTISALRVVSKLH
jgi:hypothetical protein